MPRKTIGPGPGKYVLPPLIGFRDHDISKYRNPQYSMGQKLPFGKKPFGPGPCYDVKNMTSYGKASPPAYSMKSRPKAISTFQAPGPGTYQPEKGPRMMEQRPPMYSMSFRYPPLKKYQTPGPNQYEVPSTLGPKVPDKYANAAYSMSYRHNQISSEKSPGPAKYSGIETDLYKNKLPNYTISPRVFPPTSASASPGPIYMPKLPKKQGYSFGLRTDNDPYITASDEMPCVERKNNC
ncbi:outer dense fiber protein 3-like [Anoplophora glabripennis]|uniref:outer dense fiber protein 3-like n=1 Tax=Anoplophora glabripennis TaxID=217634 RepID=UPI000A1408DD|nr:outer dense fiber protein 3-like [Anoplophora glabripennis]